jgi:hypothetical protein
MDLLKGNMLFAHNKEGAFHPSAALKVRLKEPVTQGIVELSLNNSNTGVNEVAIRVAESNRRVQPSATDSIVSC